MKTTSVFTLLRMILFTLIFVFFTCMSPPETDHEETPIPEDEPIYLPEPEIVQRDITITLPCLAEKVIFYDDFNNSTGEWKTGEETYARFELEKGYYKIDNTHQTNAVVTTVPLPYNDKGNFIIEGAVEKIAGKGECSYGITWGCDPGTGDTYFIILFEDYVLHGKKQNGKWETLINWRRSSFVHRDSMKNKIALKKENNVIHVFVNEHMIFDINSLDNFGNNTGFILFGNIMIKAHFLLVTEYIMQDKQSPCNDNQEEYLITPGHEYLFEEQTPEDKE
jgi:hypothetical protein